MHALRRFALAAFVLDAALGLGMAVLFGGVPRLQRDDAVRYVETYQGDCVAMTRGDDGLWHYRDFAAPSDCAARAADLPAGLVTIAGIH